MKDYFVSKVQQAQYPEKQTFLVHTNMNNSVGSGEEKDENWIVQKISNNKTFCCITRSEQDKWVQGSKISFSYRKLKWNDELPSILTKRKSFISYYHKGDQAYKEKFKNLTLDLIVNKSVEDGDINANVSDQYIKQLIQKDFLKDTTVLIVLLGPDTKNRKHVDWEISGALNLKVGDNYAGLLGLKLPSHCDHRKSGYSQSSIPARLADNLATGYAVIADYTTDRKKLQGYIEQAFKNRKGKTEDRRNSRKQKTDDTSCSPNSIYW